MSTEREAFESWAGEYWEIQYFRRGPDGSARQGEYLDHGLFDAWQAWQSRAALAQPEPVAWIQPDHLQKARVAPFLCRVEPTKRMSDFIPIYTEQVTHGLQMECPASATDDSGSADGVGAWCVDAAVMEHAARPLKPAPQPEPVAKVYERADGSFGIHKLGELHGGMMLYAGHAQPATDLAHELWAMAQSPGPISEVCALMAKRLAQPQPEAQPEPVERWSCPRCGSPRRAHVCHAQEPKRAC